MGKFDEIIGTEALEDELNKRLQKLITLRDKLCVDCAGLPEGRVHVVRGGKNRRNVMYYHRTEPSDKSGKYIKQSEISLAKALAQREYEEKVIKYADREIARLKEYLSYDFGGLDDVYTEMMVEKKSLVTPVVMTAEMMVDYMKNIEFDPLGFEPSDPVFTTKNGERVRSKSEIIIANMLYDYGIPYLYEYPLKDGNRIWARPDFTVVNPRTRKQYYWEHFGRMDDPNYVQKNLPKISAYYSHGIFPGENMILTFESSLRPLQTDEMELIIKKYLV